MYTYLRKFSEPRKYPCLLPHHRLQIHVTAKLHWKDPKAGVFVMIQQIVALIQAGAWRMTVFGMFFRPASSRTLVQMLEKLGSVLGTSADPWGTYS